MAVIQNSFNNLIGAQTDLSDIDKLQYLKSALVGNAANKLRIFEIDGLNYIKAWELLERSYEVKRILITRYLSMILTLPTIERENTIGLSKLADNAQQHVASLNALGMSLTPELIVHVLESKLPRSTLEKWESTLNRDDYPKVDQIYEFLYKTAICASKRQRSSLLEPDRAKREPPTKKGRPSANQTFLTNMPHNCPVCKAKRHPLYLCDNCLRSHRDVQIFQLHYLSEATQYIVTLG